MAKKDKGLWKEFSQNTTIHGLNKVAEENGLTFRRLFWITLILGGTALFAYQVVERSLYYIKWPVSVNYKFVYQSEMPFPTVTICNQNAFKLSTAVQSGLHDVITSIFSKRNSIPKYSRNNISSEWEDIFGNSSSLKTDDVWQLLAHAKEDMIYSCSWQEDPCSPDNFTTVLTDHGVCFLFNSASNSHPPLKVTQSGSQQGLSLVMNVEQYEYMTGPHDSVGLKVLLHDSSHVAMVRDLGEALPTGSHAFVAVTLSKIQNLKHPYGECVNNVSLDYYDTFSLSTCRRDCETRKTVKDCGCRDAYMPSYTDGTPQVCTLQEYSQCIQANKDQQSGIAGDGCSSNCPIPCLTTSYKSSTTFSTAFENYADDIDKESYWNRTRQHYILAREISQKVNQGLRRKELEFLSRLETEWQVITQIINEVKETVKHSKRFKADILDEMEPRTQFHTFWGLEKIKFVVDYDYVRIWDVMEERTMAYATIGFYQTAHLYRNMVDKFLLEPELTVEKVAIFTSTMRDLDVRLQLTMSTQINLTQVCDAFANGTLRWKYLTSPKRYFDYDYISEGLIQELLHQDEPRRDSYCGIWHKYLTLYAGYISKLKTMARGLLYNQTINKTDMEQTLLSFEHRSRSYLYYRHNLYTRVFKPSSYLAQERIDSFTKLVQRFKETLYGIEFSMNNIDLLVDSFNYTVWQPLSAAISKTIKTIKDKTAEKYNCAKLMTSKEVEEYVQASETFFKDLRTRGLQLSDSWRHVHPTYSAIWSSMMQERPLADLYSAINKEVDLSLNDYDHRLKMADILSEMAGVSKKQFLNMTREEMDTRLNADLSNVTLSMVTDSLQLKMSNISQMTDISFIIGEEMDTFISALKDVQSDFTSFIESTKIDNDFYRDNFIKVNIFMKDLYLEDMESNEAYSLIALLSDIGGSMGLFIGGSVMTILEVLDILVIACMRKSKRKNETNEN